jgi:CTD nuclear envelope phosphatase 1
LETDELIRIYRAQDPPSVKRRRCLLHGLDRKMNSLNILSARVSPPQTPAPSRTNSYGNALSLAGSPEVRRSLREDVDNEKAIEEDDPVEDVSSNVENLGNANEKTPLIGRGKLDPIDSKVSSGNSISKRVANVIINSLRWVVSTLAAPGVYLIACLYDKRGRFAPFYQLWPRRQNGPSSAQALEAIPQGESSPVPASRNGKDISGRRSSNKSTRRLPLSSSSSGLSSESESERDRPINEADDEESTPPSHHTRSKSLHSSDEIAPARRSIRIKLHADDSLRQRKHRKAQSASSQNNSPGVLPPGEISPATLKSPTSPAASLSMTKYPRAPAPPRPLIPRRQPSYNNPETSNGRLAQKTLILDLDETLIHSMAKGGRMSTGHMVEVRLNTYIGVAGQTRIGPQHPILYYVHTRPYCDEFLRRVRSALPDHEKFTQMLSGLQMV